MVTMTYYGKSHVIVLLVVVPFTLSAVVDTSESANGQNKRQNYAGRFAATKRYDHGLPDKRLESAITGQRWQANARLDHPGSETRQNNDRVYPWPSKTVLDQPRDLSSASVNGNADKYSDIGMLYTVHKRGYMICDAKNPALSELVEFLKTRNLCGFKTVQFRFGIGK